MKYLSNHICTVKSKPTPYKKGVLPISDSNISVICLPIQSAILRDAELSDFGNYNNIYDHKLS